MNRSLILLLLINPAIANAVSTCVVVENGKREPFDGKTLRGVLIEKKSLITLNNDFPGLNVIEKMFKGEILTCSDCQDKYITCNK